VLIMVVVVSDAFQNCAQAVSLRQHWLATLSIAGSPVHRFIIVVGVYLHVLSRPASAAELTTFRGVRATASDAYVRQRNLGHMPRAVPRLPSNYGLVGRKISEKPSACDLRQAKIVDWIGARQANGSMREVHQPRSITIVFLSSWRFVESGRGVMDLHTSILHQRSSLLQVTVAQPYRHLAEGWNLF
jgi:hypothetical protein